VNYSFNNYISEIVGKFITNDNLQILRKGVKCLPLSLIRKLSKVSGLSSLRELLGCIDL
jgi:hypothetical protein